MGMMSVGILFLTLGGFWLYLQKRSHRTSPKVSWRATWLSWHKITGLAIIPYTLIFALTGAFLGLMLSSSQPFAWEYDAWHGEQYAHPCSACSFCSAKV